jgi:Zn-finger nucleic acid-binding protein
MAKCSHCSAPLPANTLYCKYCGTRNDIDLRTVPFTAEKPAAERICPNCDTALQTVTIKLAEPLAIERCNTCRGLFFDPGEVEYLLENSVSNVFDINAELIDNINNDRYAKNQPIRYVKCPVCRVLMNRVNFGQRSGVVADRCISHGIWLDSGELMHLMEWKKAGGQLLHQKMAMQAQQQRKKAHVPLPHSGDTGSGMFNGSVGVDLVDTILSIAVKLFE